MKEQYGLWKGKELSSLSKKELCEIILQLNNKLETQREQHIKDLDTISQEKSIFKRLFGL